MNKNEIREAAWEKRTSIEKEEAIEKGNIVKEKLFSLEEYKKAKTVMFFVSYGKEIYTHDMIKEALKEKTVVIPKVKEFEMTPCIIKDFSDLAPGDHRILEPVKENQANREEIDIVIIPGIAFDKNLNRIGYGKGYFDKFLITLKKDTLKIGLCMDFQIVDNIPASDHDIKVDMVITDKRVIN